MVEVKPFCGFEWRFFVFGLGFLWVLVRAFCVLADALEDTILCYAPDTSFFRSHDSEASWRYFLSIFPLIKELHMETRRFELLQRISDFMFSSFQWTTAHAPSSQAPQMQSLIVDILEYQRTHHPLYGRYCALHGRTTRGASLLDYPPLPVESFKRADLCPFDPTLDVAEFRSSGTTEGVKSIHRFRDLTLLQKSITYAFTELISRVMPAGMRFFSLMPSSENNPHSSLGYMLSFFVQCFGGPGSDFFFTLEHGLDVDRLCDALQQAQAEGVAVHLMGPAFSYVELLDRLGDRTFSCAPGSRLLETGGYKGRVREVPKSELRDALSARLGIPRRAIYGEYGMCELTSQGYEICHLNTGDPLPDEGLFIFPAWLKCLVFNPESMAPVLPGHAGQIGFFDACNLDSAAYILTGDLGTMIALPDELQNRLPGKPKYALKLHGRAPDAVPKGCSMSWDEWARHVNRG